MSEQGSYQGVSYMVESDDITEGPPFGKLRVEIWENADVPGEYSMQEVYDITSLEAEVYHVENVSDKVYGENRDERVLTREKGETTEITVPKHQQELRKFAEEIIDSLEN
ncbi:MAG: hypothetical protein ABEK16_00450 [Candidatus Nanohalobium sp.]